MSYVVWAVFMTYVLFPHEDNPDFKKVSLKNFKADLPKPAFSSTGALKHTHTGTLSIYLKKEDRLFQLKYHCSYFQVPGGKGVWV